MNKYFLLVCIGISLFFSFYKLNAVPPCINADEAAFGYNSYSLLKTGKDEYGAFMPLRLVSFRDYKLPLYSYLSMPFMAIFGLNDFSTRALNILVAALFVPLIYLLAKEMFEKEAIALAAAFLVSFSPWIYILTRHAHEGPLATFFIILSIYFLVRFEKTKAFKPFLLTNIAIALATFSYQSARLFLLFILLSQFIILVRDRKRVALKKCGNFFLVLFFIFVFSFYPDVKYGVNRVQNLFFLKNPGFVLRINEYVGEHPNRIIHNKLTEGIRDITNRYFAQISPEYFLTHGDTNWRFGFQNLGILTPVEYLLIFVGLYYLFEKKNRYRFFIILLLAVCPLPNALTWQDASIIRSYTMIFPLILILSYGIYHLYYDLKKALSSQIFFITIISLVAVFGFYLYNNWDIYLNHYPKRAVIIRAWQCGYKEMAQYIKETYDNKDHFVITDRQGQPYIFILYYLHIDPANYQSQSKISGPDKYGFGQIEHYDKFDFKFRFEKGAKKTVYIGYPEDFTDFPVDMSKIKKIKIGTEEIFWIYET